MKTRKKGLFFVDEFFAALPDVSKAMTKIIAVKLALRHPKKLGAKGTRRN